MTRAAFAEKIVVLHQELEEGSEGAELAEVRTEADARRMAGRFAPVLVAALDHAFDRFSTDETGLTAADLGRFLAATDARPDGARQHGARQHAAAVLAERRGEGAVLTRADWYGAFAREIGGCRWQRTVHDLEACGAVLRPPMAAAAGGRAAAGGGAPSSSTRGG